MTSDLERGQMAGEVNEGVVGDTAKLMMHRLIVRMLRRDPSLVERVRTAHARQAALDPDDGLGL